MQHAYRLRATDNMTIRIQPSNVTLYSEYVRNYLNRYTRNTLMHFKRCVYVCVCVYVCIIGMVDVYVCVNLISLPPLKQKDIF